MDFQKELIDEFDHELVRTRKMLEAIPTDADFTWKPHAKSMSLGRLAGHTAELAGDWAIHILTTDKLEFSTDHKYEPYIATSKEALLERFDLDTAKAKAELEKLAPAKWEGNWKFVSSSGQAWIDESKYKAWRTWVVNHLIHHRAQLGVYLRLLNKPIPGTYGPSADEK